MGVAALADFATEGPAPAPPSPRVLRIGGSNVEEPGPQPPREAMGPATRSNMASGSDVPEHWKHRSRPSNAPSGQAVGVRRRWLLGAAAVLVLVAPSIVTVVVLREPPASELPAINGPSSAVPAREATTSVDPAATVESVGQVTQAGPGVERPRPTASANEIVSVGRSAPAPTRGPLTRATPARPLDGEAIHRQVPLTPVPVSSADLAVERPLYLGTVSVDSHVPGALVYVNGKQVGVTPLIELSLPAGSHVVRLELEGYERWSTVVQVVTGKNVNLAATLQPAHH